MNLTCDYLFLSNGELPFLLNTLKNLMDQNGLRTEKLNLNQNELSSLESMPEIFIAEAETLMVNGDARVYLVDKCIENGTKIVLIGENMEIEELSPLIVGNVLLKSFIRPIKNNEVAEELEKLLEDLRQDQSRKKILVIDDSPTFLRTISDWLSDVYAVSICPSATAAFLMIEKNKPDLILLDFEMPVCNGSQFLEMLHNDPMIKNIPVIFLTSRDDVDTVKEAIALKPQGYLLKTQTREFIRDSIESFFLKEIYK